MEVLERRDAPSIESFDTTPVGSLPAGWSQWSNIAGDGTFAVESTLAYSAPNGLAVTANASNDVARAWINAAQPADVQVSADVYLNTLIPAQVIARGTNLNTAIPTYYALSIARGLDLQLSSVVNGVSTTLGDLKSAGYISSHWASVTLYLGGTNVRAQVERLDQFQYLNSSGQWQTNPTWALNLTDTSISGGSQVGLGRPASYTGPVTFDDFAIASAAADTIPPTVTIAAPAAGTVLSGVTTVQATATDNIGVTKVEFYVDNVLRAVQTTPPATSPYSWSFDTSTAANGPHTLKVLAYDAAGNVGQASETVTTQNNTAVLQPSIPQHYPHVRLAELAYSGWALGTTETALLQNSVDLVVPNSAYLAEINSVAPSTPRLIYANASNLYLGLLTDWLTYADAHGTSREGAFYHVASATPFSGDSPSSQPVTWFWGVYRGSAAPFSNLTSAAHSTSTTANVAFGAAGATPESLYVGYTDRFREINVNLSSAASGGWADVLEYPTATDANGNPTAWATLPARGDTTAGLTQSGQITFDPPADWTTATVGGSARLFYVRFRTTSSGGTAPVANTLLGRDFVGANGTTSGTIPAFDVAADMDHDGYLNDAEYATRAPGKDARFLYESRLFTPNYGQMRFSTNPSDLGFKSWAIDYYTRYLASQPLANGLFMDNSAGKAPVPASTVLEPLGSYGSDYGAMLNAIDQAVAPRWTLANTAGGGTSADPVVQKVPGYYEEFAIRALAHNYQQFEDLAALVAHRATLTSPAPYAVLDSSPLGGATTDARTQLATLAYYYQIADPATTFLDFFGGYAPATSWTQHWSPAAAYNIGQPTGAWSVFATGADPSNTARTYKVYQRSYNNALVLYKPLSYASGTNGTTADATATTHSLGGSYYPLNADGSLGAPVTSVTLRNGEGAILVQSPTTVNDFVVTGFPLSTTAGASGTFTVTAKDASGNTVSGYTGTVHFTSTDPQAVLPANYTFTAADAGVHTFSATFKNTGNQSLTAADQATTWVSGTQSGITVNTAVVNRLQITAPASSPAGTAFSVTVTALDAYGNRATGDTDTVHFTSSDAQALLPADYTFTAADAGVHTFSATLKTAGTQSITATDTTTASLTGTDAGIAVYPAAASQFIIIAPTSVTAGAQFSLTVKVEDAYGNIVTNYTGTIHFSSTDPKARLPKDYTFTAADQGVHTFTGLVLRTKGFQKITITDTRNSFLFASDIIDVL